MKNKKFRRVMATIAAFAMLASATTAPMMSICAEEMLSETSFENKSLPWETFQASPAKQESKIEDGALHVNIITAKGCDGENWDLQTRYEHLDFKAGYTYKVSFKAKAKRDGMELFSKIGSIRGDEEYFVINEDKMQMGPHMGGDWGKSAKLTTEYQEFSGTFTPTSNISDAAWIFYYADGTRYEGNAEDGDEIWFDDMSIVSEKVSDTGEPATSVSDGEKTDKTSFDYSKLQWDTCQQNPAKQISSIEDGAMHVNIITARGADKERWDLQTICRNLDFKAGQSYKISFRAKSKRDGMELCSKIRNITGDEEYFVLLDDMMEMGPHMGGQWGNASKLTTEYHEFSGTFTPTQDIKDSDWTFEYADGTQYDGNAEDGDEIWLDDMSIIPEKSPEKVPENVPEKVPDSNQPKMIPAGSELINDTLFAYNVSQWQTCESNPAKQIFGCDDDYYALKLKIINAKGADGERWDLRLRHRNLNFKAGHNYKVKFKAKAKRDGMELCSKIGNIYGSQEYFVLCKDKMQMGPHMGGQWGKAAKLTTEYQEFSGTFTPTQDVSAAEWSFEYANGTQYDGNAQDGDQIWFKDMSIVSDCDEPVTPVYPYGDVNRDWASMADPQTYAPNGYSNNFISVNQLGYYPDRTKVAVLGDNLGDLISYSSLIPLLEPSYDFDVCDAATGAVVYSGKSGEKTEDADSGDQIYKLDFTDFKTPGKYYIKVGEWRSFEFRIGNDIYSDSNHNMLTNAMNYFYQNRSGIDIEEKYITSGDKSKLAHHGSHKEDTALVQQKWENDSNAAADTNSSSKITASGGWYDAGDYGKSVINGGISVWTLQNMYERAIQTEEGRKKFADASGTVVIPESGNKIPDVLDEAAYEIDWMSKMVVKPDDTAWGKYAGLVYHKLEDNQWTGLAQTPYSSDGDNGTDRIVNPPTFAATLNYAACAAQAARLWKPYDEKKSAFYFDEAKKAYEAYETYWYEPAYDEATNPQSLYAPIYKPESMARTNNIEQVKGDAYWAACEIFVSAKEMNDPAADDYYEKLTGYSRAFTLSTFILGGQNGDANTSSTFSCDNAAAAGTLTLALHRDLLSESEAYNVEHYISSTASRYLSIQEDQGYGIPYLYDGLGYNDSSNPEYNIIEGYEYGSNSVVLNNSIIMAYAYDLTKEVEYLNGVTKAMDYLLGTNPLSFSYITGYGSYHVENPHHKCWSDEPGTCLPKAPDGIISGGPNAALNDPYVNSLGLFYNHNNPSQRCYADSVDSWSTNEVAVNWNSPLVWITSFLQDEAGDTISPVSEDQDTEVPVTETTVTEKPAAETTVTDKPENGKVVKNGPCIEVAYGDVDGNGKVEITDLTCLSMYLLHDCTLTDNALKVADVNADGKVDLADLAHLKQFVNKDPVKLGPNK